MIAAFRYWKLIKTYENKSIINLLDFEFVSKDLINIYWKDFSFKLKSQTVDNELLWNIFQLWFSLKWF